MGGVKATHYVKGHINYVVAPNNLKMFKGFWGTIIPAIREKIQFHATTCFPPVLCGYSLYAWGNSAHERSHRAHRW